MIIFGVLVATLIIGAWQLIQTEMFSSWISKKTNERLVREFGIHANFKSIEIDMFPPATILKDVQISKKIESEGIDVNVSADGLGVYLGLWDLLSNKISIEKIELNNGQVRVIAPQLDSKNSGNINYEELIKHVKIKEIFRTFQHYFVRQLPVNFHGAGLKEIDVKINDHRVWIDSFSSEFDDDYLQINLSAEQISYDGFRIDSVKFTGALYEDNIDVEKLAVVDNLKKYGLKGKITSAKALSLDGNISYSGNGSEFLQSYLHLDEGIKSIDGYWEISADVTGAILSPNIKLDIKGYDIESDYAKLEYLNVIAMLKNQILSLEGFELKENGGKANLSRPQKIYNLVTKKIINNSIDVNVSRLYTNDFLYYLRESISPFKGRVTGRVNIAYDNQNVIFSVSDKSYLESFSLLFDGTDAPILQNPKIEIEKARFEIRPDASLSLNADLAFAKSHIAAKGEIRPDYININATSEDFSFKEFGPISGVTLEGVGKLKFTVDGPFNDVRFYFDTNLAETQLIDLNLGNVQGKLRLDLKDLRLYISEMEGRRGTSRFNVNGSIRFEEDQKYELYATFPYGTYRDALRIYHKYLPVDIMPKGLAFNYRGEYHIIGTLKDAVPRISGKVNAKNITWFNESVDRLNLNFLFENNVLNVGDFNLTKQTGQMLGQLKYDLNHEYLEYNAKLENLRLKDIAMYRLFNFGYDGRISGSFKGDGKIDSLITQTKFKVTKGNIFKKAMKDSSLIIYTDKTDMFINGALLGNILTIDSYVNFDLDKQKKKSYLNAAINSTNVKILTGFISEHNSLDTSIRGRVSANLESTFSLIDWDDLNLIFEFNEFAFRRENVKLRMNPVKRNIIIKNGEIKHWDVLLKGNDGNIFSSGEGKLSDDFRIESGFTVDSSIVEMFFPVIQKSTGLFSGRWLLLSKQGKTVSHIESTGDDIYLKLKMLGDSFEKVNFAIAVENDEFFLQKLNGKYGQGNISADGNISLKIPYPTVNLKFAIDQSRITFFKNSSVVLSGDLLFSGSTVPYSLKGDVSLLYGELLDEFSDYDVGGSEDVDNKFIPKAIDVQHIDFFKYDLGIRTFSPVIVRNQIADLQFDGALHLGGSYQSPELKGEMATIADKSRFLFKGHEFVLSDGKVIFDNDIVNKVPSINISASSTIQNYKVKVDVSGKVDKFDVKLSSEPMLSQQDILSLLTLGITSDIAKNLDESDRESITSLGLGSLIVDQFKLNRGLDSSLGFKLSVLPEFGKSDDSLLHGRRSGSSSSTNIKSATKVKVQTKLRKNLDFSFSSTLGGSMKQKKEMNLNLNLGSNTSLKFIYETEETSNEAEDSLDSIGVDFTIRKTFK